MGTDEQTWDIKLFSRKLPRGRGGGGIGRGNREGTRGCGFVRMTILNVGKRERVVVGLSLARRAHNLGGNKGRKSQIPPGTTRDLIFFKREPTEKAVQEIRRGGPATLISGDKGGSYGTNGLMGGGAT